MNPVRGSVVLLLLSLPVACGGQTAGPQDGGTPDGGSTNPDGGAGGEGGMTSPPPPTGKLDILFTVQNSSSMVGMGPYLRPRSRRCSIGS